MIITTTLLLNLSDEMIFVSSGSNFVGLGDIDSFCYIFGFSITKKMIRRAKSDLEQCMM